MPDGILYFLNLNVSMGFIVGFRSRVTFKTKLHSNSQQEFQAITYFLSQRAPSEMLHKARMEYCNIHKISERYQVASPMIESQKIKFKNQSTKSNTLFKLMEV